MTPNLEPTVTTTPNLKTDPAYDLLRQTGPHPLDVFFRPRSVAVIGATETPGSVGRTLLTNLIGSPFGGVVYPVNPKRPAVLGIRAYPALADIPDSVDLAVIVTPAPTVPGLIEECVAAGVNGAIIISAGFKEIGPEGVELERQVLQKARAGNLRIVGPNCLGVMSPLTGLNATFAQAMARPGHVAFLSQSGALLTAVLDHALRENIGFSAFASLGSMLDVGWGDLIDYLGNDANTRSIVLYMESIGDARLFLSAAREVALNKPIIVIKAGRTAIGAKAAASHTGSLTGSDDVLDTAFRRAGVLRVDTIADVYALTEALAKQPLPKGNRLTLVTNAGGPGVLATDTLIAGGGTLAPIGEHTIETLNTFLPSAWSHNNPIDVLGDAGPQRYARTLALAAADENSDGLLVILTPQAMTDPTGTAELLVPYAQSLGKPVFASWMGGATVTAGAEILARAGIPTFAYPDEAANVFNQFRKYADNLRALYATPSPTVPEAADHTLAESLLRDVRAKGRSLLTEFESKRILTAYGIPTVETRVAGSEEEAVEIAQQFGFPVVLKLNSETITHKTDVNGVHLNLRNESAVRAAWVAIRQGVHEAAGDGHFQGVTVQPMARLDGYEIILGASPDPQFGPVLLFGTGGQLVEVYQDSALALPPLTSVQARRLMEQTRIYKALLGVRGRPPVDMEALEHLLVRFSQLVVDLPLIKEIDINPLIASDTQLLALDARVVLYDEGTPETEIPRPAIRPYPHRYVGTAQLTDGTSIVIRPIRAEDEQRLIAFHEGLSERSVTLRYYQPFALTQRVAHERLHRITQADYDRVIPLIAVLDDERMIGIARLTRGARLGVTDTTAAFTLLVTDAFQDRGLGTALLRRLMEVAKAEGITELQAEILAENLPMQAICQSLDFTLTEPHGDPPTVTARRSV
ncbi:MAG: bifunctional acetate--CoA ligase family protein/GNAT family N-acetyltransferase [Capsulimonadales bacterium]|nr:bifunctional acetate--CoA ligase family protein/GNAT family N-acetyltransferase [Capsulimonadales bacterium]